MCVCSFRYPACNAHAAFLLSYVSCPALHYCSTLSHEQLSIEVIIGPLLLTKIIGVSCERHAKSINQIYSKNSVLNIEARGIYSNHYGLSDLSRNIYISKLKIDADSS